MSKSERNIGIILYHIIIPMTFRNIVMNALIIGGLSFLALSPTFAQESCYNPGDYVIIDTSFVVSSEGRDTDCSCKP